VNVDAGTAQFVLTPRLQPFLAQHPELAVEITVRDRMGDLVREGFDVSIRFGIPEPSALRARLLMRTRVITCASPAYLKRHGTPRHPAEIRKHQCVLMRNPATGSHFEWEFVRGRKAVPVNVTGQLLVNEAGPLLAACIAGQGVAQVLELYVREHLADGRLVQVLPEWSDETWPLYAYHHSAQLMSAKVRAFLDFVVALTRE
jgi:DNA-binding transcriptional LysR family regulator